MSLTERINEDLKNAMKAGEKIKTETLRSIRAGIIEFDKSGKDRPMNTEDELKILNAAAKKRREAIEMYTTHNRPELAEKESAELKVIEEYLPKQLSAEEVVASVAKIVAASGAAGPQDMAKVMPLVMKELKGKADGGLISKTLKDQLAAL